MSTQQSEALFAIISDLRHAHSHTSHGVWGKGKTTHQTVAKRGAGVPYHVAEFRHADDAQFCDTAHALVPRLIAEAESLHARVKKLEAELVKEAARTAEEKLRADQMTEQHRMQAAMNAEAREELAAQSKSAPLTDSEIESATGTQQGTPLFLAAKGITIAVERAHGIKQEN